MVPDSAIVRLAGSLAISPSVVSRYANRAAQLGIKQWPLPAEWDDVALKHAFLQTQANNADFLYGMLLKEEVAPDAVFHIESAAGDGEVHVLVKYCLSG